MGSLWSSSLPYGADWSAWYWLFGCSGYVNLGGDSRYWGRSVRGVKA